MSPEALAILLTIAFVSFVIGAVLSWPWRSGLFWVAIGLAAWVVTVWWPALKNL